MLESLLNKVLAGEHIDQNEALHLINTSDQDTLLLLNAANKIRQRFKQNKIRLCSIINAKSGRCSENCSFCAQSAHFQTLADAYPLYSSSDILEKAKLAEEKSQATCFSIVTSGKGMQDENEIKNICSALDNITQKTKMNRCVSLGILDRATIKKLKAAGLKRIHHNLETADSFFKNICTTHKYSDRIQTLKIAKEEGLELCSGGIFGLGESLAQRVELAFTLKEIGVDSIPLNILHPIEGTPAFTNYKPMSPFEVLRLIATFRFIFPKQDVGLLGGREYSLRTLQPLLFLAGANVILIGDYLVTKGQTAEKDLQMIKDLGLEISHG